MSDLIDRQAVLDAVNDCGICIQKILDIPSAELETFEFCSGGDNPCKEYDQQNHCCHRWTKVIRQTLEEIRSQQSEQKRIFLGIDVSYPKICTYPEYEGKPYYAIKYLEDGETIVGFGTYKPDMLSEYLRKYFIPSAEPERKTVKVEKSQLECPDGAYVVISGHCDCGALVFNDERNKYCPHCGCRLEWK